METYIDVDAPVNAHSHSCMGCHLWAVPTSTVWFVNDRAFRTEPEVKRYRQMLDQLKIR
jgi:hypothetical protein